MAQPVSQAGAGTGTSAVLAEKPLSEGWVHYPSLRQAEGGRASVIHGESL